MNALQILIFSLLLVAVGACTTTKESLVIKDPCYLDYRIAHVEIYQMGSKMCEVRENIGCVPFSMDGEFVGLIDAETALFLNNYPLEPEMNTCSESVEQMLDEMTNVERRLCLADNSCPKKGD